MNGRCKGQGTIEQGNTLTQNRPGNDFYLLNSQKNSSQDLDARG